MKKKALLVVLFFGGIMVTSGFGLQSMMMSSEDNSKATLTGTPADNFPAAQRTQFCGVGEAKFTSFVIEYKITTDCVQPLAITTDPQGNIWFTETNTGRIAKFVPTTKTFTEYDNPLWPQGGRSMMWGIDYVSDDSVWFTDETFSSIWKFSVSDESYKSLHYPIGDQPIPHKIKSLNSNLIVSEYSGGLLSFFSPTSTSASFFNIPQILPNYVVRDFTIDNQKNLWYPTWSLDAPGQLVKFSSDIHTMIDDNAGHDLNDLVEYFELPLDSIVPSGITSTSDGMIWITDSASSSFYMFNPNSIRYTKYVTSDPLISIYGNATGAVKNPISKPYWIATTADDKIVFNEQLGNKIALFNPDDGLLVEYAIPSKNPNWADCGDLTDCGISQVSDFIVVGDKIWFTEWVENNIGFIDTSKELPFTVEIDKKDWDLLDSWAVQKGKTDYLILNLTSSVSGTVDIIAKSSTDSKTMKIVPDVTHLDISPNETYEIPFLIEIPENAPEGSYNILLGVESDEIAVSKNFKIQIATFVSIIDDSLLQNFTQN